MVYLAEPPTGWRSIIAELLKTDANSLDLQPVGGRSHVWAVRVRGQVIALAKRHPPQATESLSPALLAAKIAHHVSPPAVRCLGVSESHHLLLTRWIDGQTLNAALQQESSDRTLLTNALLSSYLALESCFIEARNALVPFAYPMDYPRYLRDSLDATLSLADEVFHLPPRYLSVLESIISAIPPVLGPLDCNAQNLLFDGDRVWFIDLARIGWDWSERRLVQYAFGLGENGSVPRFLLNSTDVLNYAERAAARRSLRTQVVQSGVDAHALLATLVIIDRLQTLVARPGEWPTLAALWDRPEKRLTHVWQIARTPLSRDPDLMAIRACLKG